MPHLQPLISTGKSFFILSVLTVFCPVYFLLLIFQDNRVFSEDINRYKELTHLHSFTYDFHVREIQNHLSGRHSRFKKTYPVHRLMDLIIKEYPRPPRFCRCILTEGKSPKRLVVEHLS